MEAKLFVLFSHQSSPKPLGYRALLHSPEYHRRRHGAPRLCRIAGSETLLVLSSDFSCAAEPPGQCVLIGRDPHCLRGHLWRASYRGDFRIVLS